MDKSPLARLAPEIRNRVYGLVLQRPDAIVLTVNGRDCRISDNASHEWLLALPATCKQLRDETTQMFYAQNTFQLQGQDSGASQLLAWQKAIGKEGRKALRLIIIDTGEVHQAAFDNTVMSAIWKLWSTTESLRCQSNANPECGLRAKLVLKPDYFSKDFEIDLDVHDIKGSRDTVLKALKHEVEMQEYGLVRGGLKWILWHFNLIFASSS